MLLFTVMYSGSWTIGLGYTFHVHLSETVPSSIVGLANFSIFLGGIIVASITPLMINNYGVSVAYSFYACCTFPQVIYIFFFVRDTTFSLKGERITEKQKKCLYIDRQPKE